MPAVSAVRFPAGDVVPFTREGEGTSTGAGLWADAFAPGAETLVTGALALLSGKLAFEGDGDAA